MSLNSLQDPESGWAIIDEEAKVRVEETEAGPVLWLSHRRRLAAVSEVALQGRSLADLGAARGTAPGSGIPVLRKWCDDGYI